MLYSIEYKCVLPRKANGSIMDVVFSTIINLLAHPFDYTHPTSNCTIACRNLHHILYIGTSAIVYKLYTTTYMLIVAINESRYTSHYP